MAKMSAKDKRMADMKRRFQRTSPSKNIGQTISQRLLNDIFGKSKAMGVESHPKGIMSLKKPKKDKKTSTSTKMGKSPGALGGKLPTKKGKVDVGLQEALKKQKKKATPTKTKPKKPTIVTKEQLEKSGLSLRDYMNFLQGKTRRDDPKPKKVKLTKDQMPKRKPVMVDDFKKAKVKKKSKKTSAKTGLGSKAMSTKTPKKYKGTNITPTKLQRERMRKRMMGST